MGTKRNYVFTLAVMSLLFILGCVSSEEKGSSNDLVLIGQTISKGCYDADNDQYGRRGYSITGCAGSRTLYDCNDKNPYVNPGALEICDSLDNDCDGIFNEGCETDSGFDLAVAGSGRNSDGRYLEDHCYSGYIPGVGWSNALIEVACYGGNCYEFLIGPPLANIISCDSGAFRYNIIDPRDSDGGLNIFQQGTTLDGRTDSCINATHVSEAIGDGSRITYSCPEGTYCQLGACVGQPVSCQFLPLWDGQIPSDEAINLIFVGSDYHLINQDSHDEGMEAFLWDINALLGVTTHHGLFDFAPYNENQDKFNVWYVDRFGIMPPISESEDIAAHEARNEIGSHNARSLIEKCKIDRHLEQPFVSIHFVPNEGVLNSDITIATRRENQFSMPERIDSCRARYLSVLSHLPDVNGDGCFSSEDGFSTLLSGRGGSLPLTYFEEEIDYNSDGAINLTDLLDFLRAVDIIHSITLCPDSADFTQTMNQLCAHNFGTFVTHDGETLLHEIGHYLFGMKDIRGLATVEWDPAIWDKVTMSNCFFTESIDSCIEYAPWKHLMTPDDPINGVWCFEGCQGSNSYRATYSSTYLYGANSLPPPPGYSEWFYQYNPWEAWYIRQLIPALAEIPVE